MLPHQDGLLWFGAGSDHTDREVEKYGVSVSKQMCDKPIAPEFWTAPFVHDHWEEVYLVSGDLIVGNDDKGNGGEPFERRPMRAGRRESITGRSSRTAAVVLSEIHYYDESKK